MFVKKQKTFFFGRSPLFRPAVSANSPDNRSPSGKSALSRRNSRARSCVRVLERANGRCSYFESFAPVSSRGESGPEKRATEREKGEKGHSGESASGGKRVKEKERQREREGEREGQKRNDSASERERNFKFCGRNSRYLTFLFPCKRGLALLPTAFPGL